MLQAIKEFTTEVIGVVTANPAAVAAVSVTSAVVTGVASYYGGKRVGREEALSELAAQMKEIKESLDKKADKA